MAAEVYTVIEVEAEVVRARARALQEVQDRVENTVAKLKFQNRFLRNKNDF